ncbi:uncharacterized protein EDB93DRAFT_295897 [Suillus bovinus]|uniref:uncharacterized protein n=1 Tax=Suillus bovinus TaxID=48563 RepID=UPI001B860998|nr:uncharacterized protein EDB93DRAFT_295897 [Suillus bovinus]KAG2151148.1 hypothetical protein EDB93DRAFT_295897 [Suillus bovinus]
MVSINDPGEHLGKVFAIRRRRPTEFRCIQRNLSVTDWHERDGSIPADVHCLISSNSPAHSVSVSSELGLDVSTNVSSARYSWSVSSAREASDPGTMSFACPLMEVAIARLSAILQVIYSCGQHKVDLDRLTLRLHRLVNWYLWNATIARDPFERSRRYSLVRYAFCRCVLEFTWDRAALRILQEASAQLKILHIRRLSYTSVAQAIAKCSIEIDRYLLGCLWFQLQQSQNKIRNVPEGRQNHEHPTPVNFYTSFQQLNKMLQVLFERDSIAARNNVTEEEQYESSIDRGTGLAQPTSHEWQSIEAGTKTVMRVIIDQQGTSEIDYQCHFCGAVNRLGVEIIMHLLELFQRQAGCSIDW